MLVVDPDGKLRVKVASGVRADPRLAKRPSVAALGIASLACVPLRQEAKILGLIYVDSRGLGSTFTQLDVEILEALADHAATLLAGVPFDQNVRTFPTDGAVVAELQQRIEELLPAV